MDLDQQIANITLAIEETEDLDLLADLYETRGLLLYHRALQVFPLIRRSQVPGMKEDFAMCRKLRLEAYPTIS